MRVRDAEGIPAPGEPAWPGLAARLVRRWLRSGLGRSGSSDSAQAGPMPRSLHLLVDIGNKCNLRCIMCHFSFDSVFRQPSTFMTPETFARILGSAAPYLRTLTLSCAYEPTVSPHFAEILAIVGRYRIPEVTFLTNANHLPESLAEAIVHAGVTQVCVSVHAARPATYAHILRGGRLERSVANIRRLVRVRDALGSRTPRLQVNVALMRSNVDELHEIVDLAADLGADTFAFRHLIVFDGLGMADESLAHDDRRRANAAIQRTLERAFDRGIMVNNSPDYFALEVADAGSQTVDWGAGDADDWLASPPSSDGPIGNVDRPQEQSICRGSGVELSGWALSPVGIDRLSVRRRRLPDDPSDAVDQDGFLEIAEGRFHNATRCDVVAAYPTVRYNYRSGWTAWVPRIAGGDGAPVDLQVVAIDGRGARTVLGRRSVTFAAGAGDGPAVFCDKPFNSLYVDAHGNAYPYPDCHTDQPFGSLLEQEFAQVWQGPAMVGLRQALEAGTPPDMCRRCPLFMNRDVDRAEMFDAHADFSSAERR